MASSKLRHIFKEAKNRDGAQGPSQSKEQNNPKKSALCEHQLTAINVATSGGVLNEKEPSTEHQQIPGDERGPKHCPECIKEKKSASHYRWKLILSLLIPNMMASMDATITATALPTIASHFSKFKTRFEGLVNLIDRQTHTIQLDCDCLHSDLNFFNTHVRADSGCVWPSCCNPGFDRLCARR